MIRWLQALFRVIPPRSGLWWAMALSQVGLVWAPAFLSISMGFVAVWGLGAYLAGVWHPRQHSAATRWSLLGLTMLFWLVAGGVVGLEDTGYWLSRVRIKLPFLLVPLGLWLLPPMREKEFRAMHGFLLLVLVVVAVQIGLNYALHFEVINEKLKQGQPMPTPGHHIRLSLLMAYGVVSGLLLFRSLSGKNRRWRPWVGGSTLFLGLFLHILSVRSGLAVLYLGLMVVLVYEVVAYRRWGMALGGLAIIMLLPVLAYQVAPSFRNRINYAKWDRWMQQQGEVSEQLSDASRMLSWQVGWTVWRDHWWLGTGPGNLKKEVHAVYDASYPSIGRKRMPHNQFLSIGAGTGILGLLVFLGAFLWPLRYPGYRSDPGLWALYTIILASGMVENTLENAEGVGLAVWWLGWHLVRQPVQAE